MQVKTFYNNKKVTFSEKKGSTKNMFLNNPKKLRLKPTNNFRFRKTTPLSAFMNCNFYEDFEYLIKQKNCFLLLGENFKYWNCEQSVDGSTNIAS